MTSNLSITPRERTKATALGTGFGIAGMSAYYIPVSKGRFVRAAYSVVRDDALDKIDLLNEAAISATKGSLKAEQEVILDELEVGHSAPDIIAKIKELTKSITDSDIVKNLKEGFATAFEDCKKSEVMRDPIATRAIKRVKWGNFGWGAGIGFVLGSSLGILNANQSKHTDLM